MPTTLRRITPAAAITVIVATLLTACGGSDPTVGSTPEADGGGRTYAYEEFHGAAEHMEVWAAELAAGFDEHADLGGDPQSPAAELLAGLDFTLRGYVVAVTDASAAIIAGKEEAAERAREIVERVSTSLEDRIRSLASEDAADGFSRLWERHAAQLLNVASALRDDDGSAKGRALEELEKVDRELAVLLQDVTGGRIEPQEFEETLKKHVDSTVATMEAQVEGEPPPFEALREAVDHMKHVAEELAIPLAAAAVVDGEVDSEAAKMHAELSGRLAETPWFTARLTELVLAGEEIEAARSLVDHNTEELTDLISSVLDQEAAERFEPVWTRHIDLFAEYAEALRDGDTETRQQVREELTAWSEELGHVLGEAGGEALKATTVAETAETHVDTVTAAIEAQHGSS